MYESYVVTERHSGQTSDACIFPETIVAGINAALADERPCSMLTLFNCIWYSLPWSGDERRRALDTISAVQAMLVDTVVGTLLLVLVCVRSVACFVDYEMR